MYSLANDIYSKLIRKYKKKLREIERLEEITDRELNPSEKNKLINKQEILDMLDEFSKLSLEE